MIRPVHNLGVGLVLALSVVASVAATRPSVGAQPCDPDVDPDCMPTREECEAGGRDGVVVSEGSVLPASVCLQDVGYAAGDPVALCGTIVVAGEVVADTAKGDPSTCLPRRREWGYVNTRSGNQLRWTGILPEGDGPFPVALKITPYDEGTKPVIRAVGGALADAGYAIVVVNVAGTGCSSGIYDIFRPYTDLFDTVEWIARQPWSTGDVGMFGLSADGLSQFHTASQRPPSLRAIAPNEVPADVYREFLYPGGIMNVGYGNSWVAFQSVHAARELPDAVQDADTQCFRSAASGGAEDPTRSLGRMTSLDRPHWDQWYEERVAVTHLPQVDVPVLACQTWQDDQILSTIQWFDLLDSDRLWTVFTNGYHGACDRGPLDDLTVRFFDAFVDRDRDVDFDDVPRVQLWHESTDFTRTTPSWTTAHDSWPVPVEPRVLHLGDGTLQDVPDATASSTSYAHPLPAASMEATSAADPEVLWGAPPVPDGYRAWTSAPLAEDLEVFGSSSLDLWLSSNAADTDLQVTLTEVRPDGQEMYLRRGWLRASHRALDVAASTVTRPVHTHLEGDVAPLPGEPVEVRIEIPPLGHVFRAGSSIRVIVDAPTGRTGFWQFAFTPTPAINTIHHGADFPSRLVLPVVPGGAAPADRPLPACGTVLRTPCRPDPIA